MSRAALPVVAGILAAALVGCAAGPPPDPAFVEARSRCRAMADRVVTRSRAPDLDRSAVEDPLGRQQFGPAAAGRRSALMRRDEMVDDCLRGAGWSRGGERIAVPPATPPSGR